MTKHDLHFLEYSGLTYKFFPFIASITALGHSAASDLKDCAVLFTEDEKLFLHLMLSCFRDTKTTHQKYTQQTDGHNVWFKYSANKKIFIPGAYAFYFSPTSLCFSSVRFNYFVESHLNIAQLLRKFEI